MPTYDYECLDCGTETEVFQRMSEEPHTKCYVCKGRLRRKIGCGGAVLFRGSGFYCTDYKKVQPRKKAAAAR